MNARIPSAALGLLAAALAWPSTAGAHCDSLDGPVAADVRAALEHGDPTRVLKWVGPADEPRVRADFDRARRVRASGGEARVIADEQLLETVVRLHRAGEGAPYTGLTAEPPAPPVAAADRALAAGGVNGLSTHLTDGLRAALDERFEAAVEARVHRDESVAAGRDWVEAYVRYVHFVEAVAGLVEGGAHAAHAEHASPAHTAHDERAGPAHAEP